MLNKIKTLLSIQEAALTRSETIQVPWVREDIQVTILSNHRYESGHLLSMVQHQLGDEFSAKDCTNWLLGLFRSGKAVRQVVSDGDIYDSITQVPGERSLCEVDIYIIFGGEKNE
jgi:hypothetical protein